MGVGQDWLLRLRSLVGRPGPGSPRRAGSSAFGVAAAAAMPARRALAGRLAPAAVCALGVLFVAVAAGRLSAIFDGDPGVTRAWQLSPGLLGAIHRDGVPLLDAGRRWFAGTGAGETVCARATLLGGLCSQAPPPQDRYAETAALTRSMAAAMALHATDATTTAWVEAPDTVVAVSVAHLGDGGAATAADADMRRAIGAAAGTVPGRSVAGDAAIVGRRTVVAVLASASSPAPARDVVARTMRSTTVYVDLLRLLWFEAISVVPVLLLLGVVVGFGAVRFAAVLVVAPLVIAAGLLVLVAAVLTLIFLTGWALARSATRRRLHAAVTVTRRATRRGRSAGPVPSGGAVTTTVVSPPPAPAHRGLMLTALVCWAIALMTRPLFPWSAGWGAAVIIAVSAPGRGPIALRRAMRLVQLSARAAIVLALAGVAGLVPLGILDDGRLQAVAVPVAMALLVLRWRSLATGDSSRNHWFQDLDGRSTAFLAGAVALILGAGALFLASTGDGDPAAHITEAVVAAAGLLVASTVVEDVRASLMAAARTRARRRGERHVLYLRSFGDDDLWVRSPWLQRDGLAQLYWRRRELFEDVVARGFSQVGPVVAIARPGTGQRDLGAARDAIVTDDWLSAVRRYMEGAALVVVVLGTSDGLLKELDSLRELDLLDRLCVVVPPLDAADVGERLQALSHDAVYASMWGGVGGRPDVAEKGLALMSVGGVRSVMVGGRRDARTAPLYLGVAREIANALGSRRAAEAVPQVGRA